MKHSLSFEMTTPSLVLVQATNIHTKNKHKANTDMHLISIFYLLIHSHVIKHLDYLGTAHKELTDKWAFINRKATVKKAFFNKAPLKGYSLFTLKENETLGRGVI